MKIHEYHVSHQNSLHQLSARDVEREREMWTKVRGSMGDHPTTTTTGMMTSSHKKG